MKKDLPFGVQTHEISQVIVHENYRPDDKFHYEDIGKLIHSEKVKKRPTLDLTGYNFPLQFEIPVRFDQVEDQCQNGNHSLPPLFTRTV